VESVTPVRRKLTELLFGTILGFEQWSRCGTDNFWYNQDNLVVVFRFDRWRLQLVKDVEHDPGWRRRQVEG